MLDTTKTTNASLYARREAAIPRGVGHTHQIFIDRGDNAEIWDVEGKRYIDFAGGIAVLNTGHRHPQIMEAVQAQMQRFTHTCFQVLAYESYVELAERLNDKAPGNFAKKTVFLDRRRGGGERRQDRPLPHPARRRDCLYRRLPWPHFADHGADGQGRALQGRLRPLPR